MLKEFESSINDNSCNDYWYDVALFEAQKILNSLSYEEWMELSEKISDYFDIVQMRCVECLSNIDNRNNLLLIPDSAIPIIVSCFITCFESLRNIDLSSLSQN